jgi:uncharacterized protein with PQ loop repeat
VSKHVAVYITRTDCCGVHFYYTIVHLLDIIKIIKTKETININFSTFHSNMLITETKLHGYRKENWCMVRKVENTRIRTGNKGNNNFTFMRPCIVTNFFLINQIHSLISQIYFGMKLYMFGTVPLPIIRSLFAVHSVLVYAIQFVESFRARSGWNILILLGRCLKNIWHVPLLCVQWINSWWWTEELPETCSISCQNKFVKLVHLVDLL